MVLHRWGRKQINRELENNSPRTKRITTPQQKREQIDIETAKRKCQLAAQGYNNASVTAVSCVRYRTGTTGTTGSGFGSNQMTSASGTATGESDFRVDCKLERGFDDFMGLELLCMHSVVSYVVLVASAALNWHSRVPSATHDSDLRW
jgi:hypothetical protein